MTETGKSTGSYPAPDQNAIRTWTANLTRGTLSDTRSRFEGDGVRYKAKLIGMDPLPDEHGGKMLIDSMMKLKGFEIAARKQGRHKMRIWLKISSSGLKILDERTGMVFHDHDRTRISSVTKDTSDSRALGYIYKHEDKSVLFYIKTATLADPIILDIMEVCQRMEISHQPAETKQPTLQNDFSPPTDWSSLQTTQTSSSHDLIEIFSPSLTQPLTSNTIPSISQQALPAEPPQPTLSTAHILSMFPTQTPGASPYFSPPVSPGTMPWVQQGLLGNQSPFMPGMSAEVPLGVTVPPAVVLPQPGFMITNPAFPPSLNENPNALNSICMANGAPGGPGSSALDNPFL